MSPETPVEDRPAPTGGASRVRRAVVAV
ncbi:MAG: hypothetical protein JWO90_2398, partial [Solirubrobacterales bacterium]|nr:hypothetical protein [Solirubrobacterales bacterium]